MDKFSVGEVASLINCIDQRNSGLEAEILESNGDRTYIIAVVAESETRIYTRCEERQLRKKKPPQELSSWEDVQEKTGWHPQKVANRQNSVKIE